MTVVVSLYQVLFYPEPRSLVSAFLHHWVKK